MSKTWTIPVLWVVRDVIEVKATTHEEALSKVESETPPQGNTHYIDGTCRIDNKNLTYPRDVMLKDIEQLEMGLEGNLNMMPTYHRMDDQSLQSIHRELLDGRYDN